MLTVGVTNVQNVLRKKLARLIAIVSVTFAKATNVLVSIKLRVRVDDVGLILTLTLHI